MVNRSYLFCMSYTIDVGVRHTKKQNFLYAILNYRGVRFKKISNFL
jgi:hypothetical protein